METFEKPKVILTPSINPNTKYLSSEELMSENDKIISENTHLPLVAWIPDWRVMRDKDTNEPIIDEATGRYKLIFIEEICQINTRLFGDAGIRLLLLTYYDKVEDWVDKIDGILIPGGRDIDPEFYGEENTASKFEKLDAGLRYKCCLNWFNDGDLKMPMFLICFGFQVVNVIYGGKIIQDIENPDEHRFKTRTFIPTEGSHYFRASEGQPIKGSCFHHQNITNIPDCLKVTCVDSIDGTPHGIEWHDDSRTIMGALWHPEADKPYIFDNDLEMSRKIVKYFATLCLAYRESKRA